MLPLLLVLLVVSLGVCAQSVAARLQKAPAGVEEALREAATRFYTLQAEGKFRAGESLVCDESKDAYYDSFKNRWISVAIADVTWEDSFQTAKVLMSLGVEVKTLAGAMRTTYPTSSTWKVQNNAWCYYLPPPDKTPVQTPFGTKMPAPAVAPGSIPTSLPAPATAPPTPAQLARKVGFSKQELHVKAAEDSTDSLEVVNGLDGPLGLSVSAPELPGLTWTLSRTSLPFGEKAILKVVYKPVDKLAKPLFRLSVTVEPFGKMMVIPVIFAPPAQ